MFLDYLIDFNIIRKTITCSPTPEYIGDGLTTSDPFEYTEITIEGFGDYSESDDHHCLMLKTGDIIGTNGKNNFIELLNFLNDIDKQQKTDYLSLDVNKSYFIYNKKGIKFPNSWFDGRHMTLVDIEYEDGEILVSDCDGTLLPSDFNKAIKISFIELPSFCT